MHTQLILKTMPKGTFCVCVESSCRGVPRYFSGIPLPNSNPLSKVSGYTTKHIKVTYLVEKIKATHTMKLQVQQNTLYNTTCLAKIEAIPLQKLHIQQTLKQH